MKKLILLSVYASFALSATFTNPLPNASKAKENGGTLDAIDAYLDAIDAYQDGVGAMVVQQGRGVDNSVMNKLVFKYGTVAKENSLNIIDQVTLTGTASDKALLASMVSNGDSCNDGNPATTGDVWNNGVCAGVSPMSTPIGSVSTGNFFNSSYPTSATVDGLTNTSWASTYNTWGGFWQVQLTTPKVVTSMDIWSTLVDFDIQGSTNGSTWTTLKAVRGSSSVVNGYINQSFANSTSYAYYRLNILFGNSGVPVSYINEIKFN